jgi:hypothetical protein
MAKGESPRPPLRKGKKFDAIRLEKKEIPCREKIPSSRKIIRGITMPEAFKNGLIYTYRTFRQGEVKLFHHGRLAATLSGERAQDFPAEIEAGGDTDAQ